MRVTLVLLGQTRDASLRTACEGFERRLGAFCSFEVRVLRPAPVADEARAAEICAALEREADELLALLAARPRACKIALCVEGKELSSEAFAELVSQKMLSHGEFVFLVGSSHGLSERVKAACDVRLSLSRMTLPHELARLFFTEQLYRAFCILSHKKYHK